MDRIADYLQIPTDYAQALGGLRWSSAGDAVEYEEEGTFALGAQIALFVEGFATTGPLIHFGQVLHLLQLVGLGGRATLPAEAAAVAGAFRDTHGSLRNAGAFCAVLCRGISPVADPPEARQVCLWLRGVLHFHPHPSDGGASEQPASSPAEFQGHVLAVLRKYTRDEIVSWFLHGRGPIKEAAEQIAKELAAPRPRTLTEILGEATKRPRLAGAAPFVAQMVSALSLPPRRLDHQELPLGGFTDVTTRGNPEHLLPSQFALDSLEFVRRYAEKELLYFRREEPHSRIREELIVLLDQGVRTWGDVRLMLTAAVIAFGKLAERRHVTFQLTTTGTKGRPLALAKLSDEELGEALEMSDLSPDPGLALEQVLEDAAEPSSEPAVPRACDVVLLTHPRALREPDVAAAARRVPPNQRLFAVTVDDQGSVGLNEIRHGSPLRLTALRVDPTLTQTAVPASAVRPTEPWRGDIESSSANLHLGKIRLLDFDDSGEWLMAAGGSGTLHVWRVADARLEVLPRPLVNGRPMTEVDAILGVPGGFAVAGSVGRTLAVARYDVSNRTCTVYTYAADQISPWFDAVRQWFYFREWNSIVVRNYKEVTNPWYIGLDLTTGKYTSRPTPETRVTDSERVAAAMSKAVSMILPTPQLTVKNDFHEKYEGPEVNLIRSTGTLEFNTGKPGWVDVKVRPLADGKPMLKGAYLDRAWGRGTTLVATFRGAHQFGPSVLHIFRGSDGVPVLEHRGFQKEYALALSRDGRRVAFQTAKRRLKVGMVSGDGGYYLVTFDAKRELKKLSTT